MDQVSEHDIRAPGAGAFGSLGPDLGKVAQLRVEHGGGACQDLQAFSDEGRGHASFSRGMAGFGIPHTIIPAYDCLSPHPDCRSIRQLRRGGGPSRFRFLRLESDYEHYWKGDSDATSSFSNHELYLWFQTRGDVCLNCPSEARLTFRDHPTAFLIIQKRVR